MELWYPVGYADSGPWFEVRGTVVYTTRWHPAGRSLNPWLQIRNGAAYPVLDHPMAGAARPWYELEPCRAVPTQANPDPMQFAVVVVAEGHDLTSAAGLDGIGCPQPPDGIGYPSAPAESMRGTACGKCAPWDSNPEPAD